MEIIIRELGLVPYRDAWRVQEEVHGRVVGGESAGEILTVEHPAVITLGRRAEVSASHLLASAEVLGGMGIEVVESDRGGDITYHGPGQVVVYPIVRLSDYGLSVGGYVRLLQEVVVEVLGGFGISGFLESGAVGVWAEGPRGLSKVCAVGVRVKGGVTLHGLALNVTTDLSHFELIVPCGLAGRPVTSMAELMGGRAPPPPMGEVAERVAGELGRRLGAMRR